MAERLGPGAKAGVSEGERRLAGEGSWNVAGGEQRGVGVNADGGTAGGVLPVEGWLVGEWQEVVKKEGERPGVEWPGEGMRVVERRRRGGR